MTQAATPEYVSILSVQVDRVTQAQAIEFIDELITAYRGAKRDGQSGQSGQGGQGGHDTLPIACQQVVTANTEFVMEAQHNAPFRQCINDAALCVADGAGLIWASRYLGKPLPERVTGTDLLAALASRCADRGYRLYLLGAAPGVAELAAQRLQQLAPGLQIAGTYAGSPARGEELAIIERVRAASADVLCVAYGAPAQELWITRNRARLPVAVAMGVGGAYDFLAGRQKRAPRLLQRLSLEWLYRLYREPWRWRRMLALPHFVLLLLVKGRTTS